MHVQIKYVRDAGMFACGDMNDSSTVAIVARRANAMLTRSFGKIPKHTRKRLKVLDDVMRSGGSIVMSAFPRRSVATARTTQEPPPTPRRSDVTPVQSHTAALDDLAAQAPGVNPLSRNQILPY